MSAVAPRERERTIGAGVVGGAVHNLEIVPDVIPVGRSQSADGGVW